LGAFETEIIELWRKNKSFSALTIFIIIIATITALCLTGSKDLSSVKDIKMTKNSINSISLSWKEVKKADGYYVYNLDNNANKYVKLGESKGNIPLPFCLSILYS